MMMNPIIRVALVEDNPAYRQLLSTLLNETPGLQCVAVWGRAEEALRLLPVINPNVVLVDLELPGGMSGIALLRQLRQAKPQLPLVVLTKFEDPSILTPALHAGADGYVLKSDLPRIVDAIRLAHKGESYLTPAISRIALAGMRRDNPTERLTPKENTIMEQFAAGLNRKAAAAALGISPRTLDSHLNHIYSKLRVRNLADALLRWAEPPADPFA